MLVNAPLFRPTVRPLRAARTLAIVVLASCCAQACAYPRRDTNVSPSPPGEVGIGAAPADMWSLRILDAQLPPRKNTGGEWDSDGSGPDAFVRVIIDGRTVWESEVVEDTTEPHWDATLPANILVGSDDKFSIEVWDRDSGMDGDPLGHSHTNGLPITARADSEASLTLSNLGTIRILISDPRPQRGVGLNVELHPDELRVREVKPHSPAARAGIKPGDRIVEIGPVSVSHMSEQDALSNLSLASDRHTKLVVLDEKGTRREVELDNEPLWLTL